jgi:hypothetical protein
MNELTIKHKYNSGDVVYFMKDDKIRKGVVSKVKFIIETKGFSDGYYVENLFKKLIFNFIKEREYLINLQYVIDLVWTHNGVDKYESTPHYFTEDKIFSTKKDLIDTL